MMFIVAMVGGGLMGAANGAFVAALGVSPFVVTLSMVFLARGLQFLIALTMVSGTYLMLPHDVTRLGSTPAFLIGTCAIVAVLLYVLMDHTVFGRYLRAVGKNLAVARLSGIPVRLITWSSYVLCGAMAAIGGVLLTSQEGMAAPVGSGESYLIDAFLLPILGQAVFRRFSVPRRRSLGPCSCT